MADVWYFSNLAYELMSPGTGLHPTPQGMVFGLLGVNGAGKTTSFKLMSGQGAAGLDGSEYFHHIATSSSHKHTHSHTHHIT